MLMCNHFSRFLSPNVTAELTGPPGPAQSPRTSAPSAERGSREGPARSFNARARGGARPHPPRPTDKAADPLGSWVAQVTNHTRRGPGPVPPPCPRLCLDTACRGRRTAGTLNVPFVCTHTPDGGDTARMPEAGTGRPREGPQARGGQRCPNPGGRRPVLPALGREVNSLLH